MRKRDGEEGKETRELNGRLHILEHALHADFVREPLRMFVAADVVVFSGSLNTVEDEVFYPTVRRAFDSAAETLVFNFLASNYLAGAAYLRWRRPADVIEFVSQLTPNVESLNDYLQGDFTVALHKQHP